MSGASAGRLLAFELAGALFALPIAEVAEVAELGELAAVPMLPHDVGGVVNHHGDALVVVNAGPLLDRPVPAAPRRQLLVLARDPDDPDRFGVPIDRIHGLVDGPPVAARDGSPIAARRPEGDRVLHILDARCLFERATVTVERSMAPGHAKPGGES